MPHTFHPTILREYDIRGIVDKTLHVPDALALGKAFGSMVVRAGGKTVMVGYDGRTHSPGFEAALVEGLVSTGLTVDRIGLGPTPMLYFAVHHAKASAGIMVTGSHNPGDQNGFKMLIDQALPGGGPVYGEAIKALAALAAKGDYVTGPSGGGGIARQLDVRDAYVQRLLQDYKSPVPLKTVWDCGNGAAGEILARVVRQLPGEHHVLFPDIDGSFPNHHPDPTVADNLVDLQKAVAEHKADLGIAFDGDADRIGAVDGQGRIVAGDQLLAIYASEVLKHHPGAPIIADVKASQALFDTVKEMGGQPVMWKTGHSLIKVKMAETGSPLAGEMSGHVFFADTWYGFDDAIYAGIRLLSVIGLSGRSLAQWRDSLPASHATPELRFAVDDVKKFQVVAQIREALTEAGAQVNAIDGVRVTTRDGWWLLRASNTQAALVARAESRDAAGLTRLKAAMAAALGACGLKLPEKSEGH